MIMHIVEHTVTYPSCTAKSVKLVGNFGTWSGCIDMKKEKGENDMDCYKSKLFVPEGATIKYRFYVNNKHWGLDPYMASVVDENGYTVNVAHISSSDTDSVESLESDSDGFSSS